MFTKENYIVVPGFAVIELGLSGNELLCYSLIYGFTQDQETEFHGSLAYVSSALNITRGNAKKVLDRLLEKGLVEKREIFFSGVKFCHYIAKRYGVSETITPGIETTTPPVIETSPNNIDRDKINNNAIREKTRTNEDPILFEDGNGPAKKKPRGTSEPLCLFSDSRYFAPEVFAQQFVEPEYQEIDIEYYRRAMADWSSSKGAKKKDWIATARNFMRGDAEKGRLHTIKAAGVAGGLTRDEIDYLEEMGHGIWDKK